MSLDSSTSTMSRKASTSSSSYPRLPIGGFLNATLWTSAGVNGIRSPQRLVACRFVRLVVVCKYLVKLRSILGKVLPERQGNLPKDDEHDEQDDDAQVEAYSTQLKRRDQSAQQLDGWVRRDVHHLDTDGRRTGR